MDVQKIRLCYFNDACQSTVVHQKCVVAKFRCCAGNVNCEIQSQKGNGGKLSNKYSVANVLSVMSESLSSE